MLPGIKARLVAEVKDLQLHPKYSSQIALKTLKVHRPPGKANYIAWLGGILLKYVKIASVIMYINLNIDLAAILGATEAIVTRSYTRDTYLQTKRVPDWNNLADNVKETESTRAG